ncbi:MAG: ATP-binding cassette domain-containing protein [Clostridiales bacterium]|nr:ATP-binding cassette domain-containing protein [Clostridiales bacterium]
MYLESFLLPDAATERALIEARMNYNGGIKFGYIDNQYPCGIFPEKDLREISFGRITIFYGGNGSGKSTLLNLIAEKLELNRIAPYNSSEMIPSFVSKCSYSLGYDDEGFRYRIPNGSRIITSDDIFDYMLTVRTNNNEISENKEAAREGWANLKFGETVKFSGLDDYEALRMQVLARSKSVSRRQFIRRTAGNEVSLNSNGETAIRYFEQKLKDDTLYLLDEPENSMSPKMQLELVSMLESMARYCGCQFVIATHSPFLLALEGAQIYDLDSRPVMRKPWYELENTRIYYDFFKKHSGLFEEQLL